MMNITDERPLFSGISSVRIAEFVILLPARQSIHSNSFTGKQEAGLAGLPPMRGGGCSSS
jgi:hypothetical protein